MAPSSEQLLQAALQLPCDDRHELIAALIASTEPDDSVPFDDIWRSVIQRRFAEIDSGAVATVPWEDVRARVHQRLNLDV